MKGLKIVILTITAFVIIGIAGCSKPPLKVPDVSILRVAVPRISTSNSKVAKRFCQWFNYATDGSIMPNLRVCESTVNSMIPKSLMTWKVPTTHDTDHCTLTDKSEKCKKIVKIFFMQFVFVTGENPVGLGLKTHNGNITVTNGKIVHGLALIEDMFKQVHPKMSINVKATTEWLNKINKLAKENPPKQPS